MKYIWIILLVLLMSGCATKSIEECIKCAEDKNIFDQHTSRHVEENCAYQFEWRF